MNNKIHFNHFIGVIIFLFSADTNTAEAQILHSFYINSKVGYKNDSNQTVVPAIYDAGSALKNGFAIVVLSNKRGLINASGYQQIHTDYEEIYTPVNGIIVAKQNGLFGVMNLKQQWLISPIFTKAFAIKNNFIRVEFKNKIGFIDINNVSMPATFYDDASDFANSVAAIKIANKWGYVNQHQKIIIPCKYEYAFGFKPNATAIVGWANKEYLINKQGKILQEIEVSKELDEHEHYNVKTNRK
jgi:WG containing repeat